MNLNKSMKPLLPLIFLLGCTFSTPAAMTTNTIAGAATLFQAGKYTAALQTYDALAKGGGAETHAALYGKARCLLRLTNTTAAVHCWEEILKKHGIGESHEEALVNLVRAYAIGLNRPEQAIGYYERLLREYPSSRYVPEARYQCADICCRKRDYVKAKTLLQQFLKETPDHPLAPKAKDQLAFCERSLKNQAAKNPDTQVKSLARPEPLPRVERELQEAEALFKQSLYREALKSYQSVRNASYGPGYDLALYRMGQCYSALGDEKRAIQSWQAVVDIPRYITNSPYADKSLLAIGDTHFDKLADPDSALKAYARLAADRPESPLLPTAQKQIGLIYLYQDKLPEAKSVFEQLLAGVKIDPEAPPSDLQRLLDMCDGKRGRFLPDLKLTARGQKAATQIRLGDVYFTGRDYGKAVKAYERAEDLVRGTEEGAYALMQAGRCYNQLGQFPKALACYNPFLNRYKGTRWAADAMVRAAAIYVGPLDNSTAASTIYEMVVQRYPLADVADQAQLDLATLAYWNHNLTKALALHEEFVRLFPKSRYLNFVVCVRLPEIKAAISKRG